MGDQNLCNRGGEKKYTRKQELKSRMGHISNTGYNSQFHQVWGAESLRNDYRDNNNNNNSSSSSSSSSSRSSNNNNTTNNTSSSHQRHNYGVSTSQVTGSRYASNTFDFYSPGSNIRGSTNNRGSSNNTSIFGGLSSGGGQENSAENIWGPSSF